MKPRRWGLVVLSVVALAAAGCGGGSSSGSDTDLHGKTVNVIGTWGGDEQTAFLKMVAPWEQQTGAKVKYTGTRDINTVLTTGVASGVLPDLAGLPGPGQMAEYAKRRRSSCRSTTCSTCTTYQQRHRAGAGPAGQVRRQGLRRLHQGRGQGPDLVQPQAARLRREPAEDLGRT